MALPISDPLNLHCPARQSSHTTAAQLSIRPPSSAVPIQHLTSTVNIIKTDTMVPTLEMSELNQPRPSNSHTADGETPFLSEVSLGLNYADARSALTLSLFPRPFQFRRE